MRLPTHAIWVKAYADDPNIQSILKFVLKPSLITNKAMRDSVNHNYRGPLRKGHIVIQDGLVYLHEAI